MWACLGGWDGTPEGGAGANFSVGARTGQFPLPVQFTDTSTNAPTAWAWSFGDGEVATTQHPLHVYRVPGTYEVTLTVTALTGALTHTRAITLVEPWSARQRPTPRFCVDSGRLTAGTPITFSSHCRFTSQWSWTFEGGTPATASGPGPHTVTFNHPGKYRVSLTAANSRNPGGRVAWRAIRVR